VSGKEWERLSNYSHTHITSTLNRSLDAQIWGGNKTGKGGEKGKRGATWEERERIRSEGPKLPEEAFIQTEREEGRGGKKLKQKDCYPLPVNSTTGESMAGSSYRIDHVKRV